ncbi:9518_t:CDS:2 [Cetraspora pellucida]|uniref:9518_t:CDS:1 n=1 Tax=Cetraspora pellucida TaxID=1433469 RepID=A0A9N9AKZ2_9GLOM|nr:9518_t:CDS:2 [Cetraspora pellucida]
MPEASLPYMPNTEAIRKQISHVRHKDLPSQPQSLEDIDLDSEISASTSAEINHDQLQYLRKKKVKVLSENA